MSSDPTGGAVEDSAAHPAGAETHTAGGGAHLVVPARFAGPPGIGNGGWVAGRLSSFVVDASGGDAVTVTLREPTPLDVALDVRTEVDGRTTLGFGGAVLAEAAPGLLTRDPVDPVDLATAQAAMAGYAGQGEHPYTGCFVCGVDRPVPDGMGLRPGPVPGRPGVVASEWVPGGSTSSAEDDVPAHLVWAALDCTGGWSGDLLGRSMLLGRITAAVDALPEPGDRCVVVGRHEGDDGRKTLTTSTAYDGDGRVLGRAEAVWISLQTPLG